MAILLSVSLGGTRAVAGFQGVPIGAHVLESGPDMTGGIRSDAMRPWWIDRGVDPSASQEAETSEGIDKSDKSGTNPLNLQRTFQLTNEFNDLGNAHVDYTRLRYTEPFADGSMSLRLEVPFVYAHAALASSGASGSPDDGVAPVGEEVDGTRSGIGDLTLKWSWVAFANRKGGLLTSLELSAPTATHDALGTEKWVIAPTLTYGMFLSPTQIFAPSYKHSVSIAGNDDRSDIHSGNIDLYFVTKFDQGRQWITIDPTYILNYESDKYSGGTLRVQYGRLLGKVGKSVISGFIKPGVGIGADRPNDWSCEIGITVIGF